MTKAPSPSSTPSPAGPGKDTIYVDIEDEITSIIDKVVSSDQKIVALVLPKRASSLQSIVNMRLLKRSADGAKKKIVLITSEASLLPLAGIAGLHVAKSLQSKPEVPNAPDALPNADGVDDLSDDSDSDEVESEDGPDLATPVGALAAGTGAAALADEEPETIDLDNDDEPAADEAKDEKPAKPPKTPKDKKLSVPNFDRFRILLIAGAAALILLIIFIFLAIKVLPKATVTLTTDSSAVSADLTLTTSGKAQTLDENGMVLPSVLKTSKQTGSATVPATGTKDLGTKATGNLTLTNCINDGVSHTISSGTGFSQGDKTFITDSPVTLDPALYSGSHCKSDSFGLSQTVPVTAISAGDAYNLSAGPYTVPAALTTSNGSVSATGTEMTGGTTNIAKVVAQADIDAATAKISSSASNSADAFKKTLSNEGLYEFEDAFTTSQPVVTTSPNLGDAASNVTVTQTVTYTALTVQKDDLSKLVLDSLNKQINTKEQKISDTNVLNNADIRVTNKSNTTDVTATVHKDSTAIPIIDANSVKSTVAGKKKGDVQDLLSSRPGVKAVDVTFSPFWVDKVPGNASKVTVVLKPVSGGGSGN